MKESKVKQMTEEEAKGFKINQIATLHMKRKKKTFLKEGKSDEGKGRRQGKVE